MPLRLCRCCASWLYPRPSSEEMSIAEKNLSFAHERLSKSYLIPQKYFWGAKWLLEPKRTQVVSQGIPGINALSAFFQDNWIISNFVTKRKIYFWNHVLFFTIYGLLFWFIFSHILPWFQNFNFKGFVFVYLINVSHFPFLFWKFFRGKYSSQNLKPFSQNRIDIPNNKL